MVKCYRKYIVIGSLEDRLFKREDRSHQIFWSVFYVFSTEMMVNFQCSLQVKKSRLILDTANIGGFESLSPTETNLSCFLRHVRPNVPEEEGEMRHGNQNFR